MSQHTPGPWYAHPLVLQVVDKSIWFDDDGSRHGDTPNMVIDCGSVADTHLIASAPDLLNALEGMIEVYGGSNDVDGLPKHVVELNLIQEARAAIAKAKGV